MLAHHVAPTEGWSVGVGRDAEIQSISIGVFPDARPIRIPHPLQFGYKVLVARVIFLMGCGFFFFSSRHLDLSSTSFFLFTLPSSLELPPPILASLQLHI